MGDMEGRIVEGPGYRGVVLPEEVEAGPPAPGGRWTPTEADVAQAERLVREHLGALAASPAGRGTAVSRLVARLADYRRQYVGLRGEDAEQSMWINFFDAPEAEHPGWTRATVSACGAGDGCFQLTVDMDAFLCRGLRIGPPR
ncbi:MAG: hypothetical protein HY905_00650 [Deltaproteobacteria bacterium]|nr:hypothetical protein [Deltaproteobacteria bacterium]